jgi:hypothetical protein
VPNELRGEEVHVRRGHLPVAFEGTKRHAQCDPDSLTPDDVRLYFGSDPVPVTAIGTKPQRRIHALLLDVSSSMHRRMPQTRAAAIAYLDSLPPEDDALVATFDANLVLRSPLGASPDERRHAVQQLEVGFDTALWDSLFQLVAYLDSLDGEKVIVVLSDGEDTRSVDREGTRLLERADAMPDVSVFPIGIDLSRDSSPAIRRAQEGLSRLARRTGGRFFEIRDVDGLGGVFRKLRRRLDGRRYVSFVPPAVPPRPKAKVRLRLARPGACKVVVLRPSPVVRQPGASTRSYRPVADEKTRIPVEFPGSSDEPDGSPSYLTAQRGAQVIEGRVREASTASTSRHAARSSAASVGIVLKPEYHLREISIPLPPLEVLQRRVHDAVDALEYLLESGVEGLEPDGDGPGAGGRSLIQGSTLLHLRPAIGEAILVSRPDYRAWAEEAIDGIVQRRLRELERSDPALGSLVGIRRASFERVLREVCLGPGNGAVTTLLAEWLGDVDAPVILHNLERRTVERMLAGGPGDPWQTAERLRAAWPALARLFMPARDARLLALLQPAYDARRERVGFYRFVVPASRRRIQQRVSPLPFGVMTFDWLAADPSVRAQLSRWKLIDLEGRRAGRREVQGAICPAMDGSVRSPRHALDATLAAGDGPRLHLVAYFHSNDSRPACLRTSLAEEFPEPTQEIVRTLRQQIAIRGVLLDDEADNRR